MKKAARPCVRLEMGGTVSPVKEGSENLLRSARWLVFAGGSLPPVRSRGPRGFSRFAGYSNASVVPLVAGLGTPKTSPAPT